jgi:hypothetical protein
LVIKQTQEIGKISSRSIEVCPLTLPPLPPFAPRARFIVKPAVAATAAGSKF